MRGVLSMFVLATVVLAGCTGGGPTATSPSDAAVRRAAPLDPVTGLETGKRPTLDFRGCAEANVILPIPAAEFGTLPHGLKVKTTAAALVEVIFTIMSCAEYQRDAAKMVPHPTAGFGMVAVEPHASVKLDGVTGYYYVAVAATPHEDIRSLLESYGVDADNATIDILFSDVATSPKARSTILLTFNDFQLGADTLMAGSPAAGAAGTLGLYTGDNTASKPSPLRVHYVNFTAYRGYDKGVAVIRPGFLPLPVGFIDEPMVVRSTHNIDYGARFDFSPIDVAR